MQADDPKSPKYKGTIDCFRQIMKQKGFNYLMKGFTISCIRTFALQAATFVGWEQSLRLMKHLTST